MERVYTLDEIDSVATELLALYGAPVSDHAVLWGFTGDLGAGKTTLVQALARVCGVREPVTSPTFILEKIYTLADKPFERLIHMDAYRFESPEEIRVVGWEEITSDPKNFIVLEWPERIVPLLPPFTKHFELTIVDENTRRITYAENS